jgi:hypothetical protein
MSTSATELMQDAHQREHGYDEEVRCSSCPEAAIVRFRDGEPVEESSMQCRCGGEMEVI